MEDCLQQQLITPAAKNGQKQPNFNISFTSASLNRFGEEESSSSTRFQRESHPQASAACQRFARLQ
jgi:hypothetical protein